MPNLQINYAINKTDVYNIDATWSMILLELKDYGPKNNKVYRFILVIIYNLRKFGWTVLMENKIALRKQNIL